jgi:hypothetical protein
MPTRFLIEERTDYQNAKPFGTAGPYEFIIARALTDAGEGRIEVLKPRDPAKGNGTFIFELNAKQKVARSNHLLEAGHTFVHLMWKDPATAAQGVHHVLNFLRATGGPMLLGDQPRFAKRLLAANASSWLPAFIEKGLNKGARDRTLIDGEWPPKDAAK